VVTVTPRTEIDAEQKKELTAWQADSLYGVVSGLDRTARLITLAVSAGDKQSSDSIDVSPNAAYWFFPRNTIGLNDAVPGSLDRVAPGDKLYVRGTKDGASQKFVASLIVSGGFRSFAATIETMETLDERLTSALGNSMRSGRPGALPPPSLAGSIESLRLTCSRVTQS